MTDTADISSSRPSCSSCAKLREALEASKKEHSLTLKIVKEKIISTDELIRKYQQKCLESEKNLQQATDFTVKLEAAEIKIEALQNQFTAASQSTEPLRKNVARLHREKCLADSNVSDMKEKVQNLEKLNAELINSAKLKSEQESALQLEKQVQALELQKQKKSLEKNETAISKLQEQLKKEKGKNREINKSLMQANRRIKQLEQQLRSKKFKGEAENSKLDEDLARALDENICGTARARKTRQKLKSPVPAQLCNETSDDHSEFLHPNRDMGHVLEELKGLSDVSLTLSPLPPSPDRETLESSSSSEESDVDSGGEDDGKASDDGESDSSLGDLADMIIGEVTEAGELIGSPEGPSFGSPAGDEESITNFEVSTSVNSNADNERIEHNESLAEHTQNDFSTSESMSLSDFAVQTNSENRISENELCLGQSDILNQKHEKFSGSSSAGDAKTEKRDRGIDVKPEVASKSSPKFTAAQRKEKRRVAAPTSRVMTRSRAKAIKLSISSDGDSAAEPETGEDADSSQASCPEYVAESLDTELKHNRKSTEVMKLVATANTDESEKLRESDTEVFAEEGFLIADAAYHKSNIEELGHSAASLSSMEKEVVNESASNIAVVKLDAAVDYSTTTTTTNTSPNNDNISIDDEKSKSNNIASTIIKDNDNSNASTSISNNDDKTENIASTDSNKNNIKNRSSTTSCDNDQMTKTVNSAISNNSDNSSPSTSISDNHENTNNIATTISKNNKDDKNSATSSNNNHTTKSIATSITNSNDKDIYITVSNSDNNNSSSPTTITNNNDHTTITNNNDHTTITNNNDHTTTTNNNHHTTTTNNNHHTTITNNNHHTTTTNNNDHSTTTSLTSNYDKNLTTTISNDNGQIQNSPSICESCIKNDDLVNAVKEEKDTIDEISSFDGILEQKEELLGNNNNGTPEDVENSFKIPKDDEQDIGISDAEDNFGLSEVVKDNMGFSENIETDMEYTEIGEDDIGIADVVDDIKFPENVQDNIGIPEDLEDDLQICDVEEPPDSASAENINIPVWKEGILMCSSFMPSSETLKDKISVVESPTDNFNRDLTATQAKVTLMSTARSSDQMQKVGISKTSVKKRVMGRNSQEENLIDFLSGTTQEAKEISNEDRMCGDSESDISNVGGPLLGVFGTESELQESKFLHTSYEVDSQEQANIHSELIDDLSITVLMSNLGVAIGDQFRTLSPLPPSPRSSVDEMCRVSPVEDFIRDFPPLSPLPPSPCSLEEESSPQPSTSVSDFSIQTQECVTNATDISTSTQHQQLTSSYTELVTKSIRRISRISQAENVTKTCNPDLSQKNETIKSKTEMSKPVYLKERKSLKRPIQRTTSESSGNDFNSVSRSKKIRMVNRTQETSSVLAGLKAQTSMTTSTNKEEIMDIDTNEGPMLANTFEQISKILTENKHSVPKKVKAKNITNTDEPKDSKYRPLSARPKYKSEYKYVEKCLVRLRKDNVKMSVVVERLTSVKCLSSCTIFTSAVVQFLKKCEDDLMPEILSQLEAIQPDADFVGWNPVESGFEVRLLELLTQLRDSETIFGNVFPQIVTLCSRSLITTCCHSRGDNLRGTLSLCRVLTGSCQIQEDLGCIRVVCYDVMRLLYKYKNSALELVVSMVTVWPEVLKTSSSSSDEKQSLILRTLKIVLLYWANSATDFGNVLRVLCVWKDEPVTIETVKDFGMQLSKMLNQDTMANFWIGEDGSLVADRLSFELLKSLELLSCVLGWPWVFNELIIKNIWRILQKWADEEPVSMKRDEDTVTVGEQNESLEIIQSPSTRKSDICGCQTTSVRSVERKADELNSGIAREMCSNCGKVTARCPESQIILCIQLLGTLCKIAIENNQSPAPEVTDLLCALMEETTNATVTYAIQLATAISLLDMSPWQPDKVIAVLSKWLAELKESGSHQAPACVSDGLVCLKSIAKSKQT